jgi:dTDP-glucose 4,6-dehydratase
MWMTNCLSIYRLSTSYKVYLHFPFCHTILFLFPHNYTFVKADICDVNAINGVFSSCAIDYIINFAAESHVDRSIEDPSIFLKTNILGTQVLLDAARKYGVKKFVQISTDEVYGSLGLTGYFTEDTPLSPNSPYSASKASADMLVMAYYRTYGLPANITRCSK